MATHRLSFGRLVKHFSSSAPKKKMVPLTDFDRNIVEEVRRILPDVSAEHHKGQHGRIGIIGGSEEYTGAPYFAGISALRVGADLVHIFCAKDASQAIKSYSPDLIVHPLLDRTDAVQEITKWLERLHVLVIGPGLGQNPLVMDNVRQLLQTDPMKNLKLIIDADGLKLFEDLKGISGLSGILTPNAIEFQRLFPTGIENVDDIWPKDGSRFVIMKKGKRDQIYDSVRSQLILNGAEFEGSGRRCGGQGDLLSGSIATLLHWASLIPPEKVPHLNPAIVACQGASLLIKLCNFHAFTRLGRGTLAADMIEEIPLVFHKYFEQKIE